MEKSAAFFGEDGESPLLYDEIRNLRAIVQDDDCTRELVEACSEIERVCGPELLVMPMPAWLN